MKVEKKLKYNGERLQRIETGGEEYT